MNIQILPRSTATPPSSVSCAVCAHAVRPDVIYCTACDTPHDPECWRFNGGCATYACAGDTARPRGGPVPAARVPAGPTPERARGKPDLLKKQLQLEDVQRQAVVVGSRPGPVVLFLLLIGATLTVLFHRTAPIPARPVAPVTQRVPGPVGPPCGYTGPYAPSGHLPSLHEILALGRSGPAGRPAVPRLLELIARDGILALPAAEALAEIGLTDPGDIEEVARLARATERDEVRPALIALAMFHGAW